jgi:hypothetical protein
LYEIGEFSRQKSIIIDMIKVGEVIINNKSYFIWNVPGKIQPSYNGEPDTWWVYFADSLPDGMTPPADSESWKPYTKGINRLAWDLQFTEYNYTKEKWTDTDFRNSLKCRMSCNGKLIYEFGTHDMGFALGKAQYLMVILCEHFYNFLNPEKELGRKIWWYGLPATVKPREAGKIGIIPDYSTGIDRETWWKEFKLRRSNINEKADPDDFSIWDDEDEGSDYINWGDALSDGHIGWHRK